MASNFISNACVNNLLIFYDLLEKGSISLNDYCIPNARLKRYIANIRYMLADNYIYHIDIVYDYAEKRYFLVKNN